MAQPLATETPSPHSKHQVSKTGLVHPNEAQRLSGPPCNGLPNRWDCHLTEHHRVRVRPNSPQTGKTDSRCSSLRLEQVGLHQGPTEVLVRGLARRLNQVIQTHCPNEFHKVDHLLVNVPTIEILKQARRVVTQIPGVRSQGDQLLILAASLEHLGGPELATTQLAVTLVQILALSNHPRGRCNLYWTG